MKRGVTRIPSSLQASGSRNGISPGRLHDHAFLEELSVVDYRQLAYRSHLGRDERSHPGPGEDQ